jgi:hypothetical protein
MRKKALHIGLRVVLLMVAGLFAPLGAHAQWTAADSVRLQQLLNGEGELHFNEDARKSIQLDLTLPNAPQSRPLMNSDKPWMEWDSSLPTFFDDTTRLAKPHLTLRPYSAFTKWNEDPFAKWEKLDRLKKLKMHWKLNRRRQFNDEPNRQVVLPGMDPEIGPGRGGGVGASVSFDANRLLYESLTKRGRAIRHNRTHAKAWKVYDKIPDVQYTDSVWQLRRFGK